MTSIYYFFLPDSIMMTGVVLYTCLPKGKVWSTSCWKQPKILYFLSEEILAMPIKKVKHKIGLIVFCLQNRVKILTGTNLPLPSQWRHMSFSIIQRHREILGDFTWGTYTLGSSKHVWSIQQFYRAVQLFNEKKKKIHKYIDHYKPTLSKVTAFAAISDEEKQKCSQNSVCWNNGQEHRH